MATRAVPPPDYKMQMIIIGDSGVGKTSFMDRFVEGSHQVAYNATVGIDFKVKRVEIDQKTVKIQIWDTAGQEKFNAITTAYYRQARAAIVMYDVTRSNTFMNIRKWLKMIEDNGRSDIVVAIVGNKNDSPDKEVDQKRANLLRDEYGCYLFQSSAKGDDNVYSVFDTLARDVIKKMPRDTSNENLNRNLTLSRNDLNDKKGCPC